MKTQSYDRILRLACWLALAGIGLMVWSLLEPTPMPVLVAMSVGQGVGTLSLVVFLSVVAADLRRSRLGQPTETADPSDKASH
jgi:hypothetical protein